MPDFLLIQRNQLTVSRHQGLLLFDFRNDGTLGFDGREGDLASNLSRGCTEVWIISVGVAYP